LKPKPKNPKPPVLRPNREKPSTLVLRPNEELLYALLAPSLDAVGEMYQRQKSILNTAFAQKAESSLHHRVEASILAPARPTDEGQRAAKGL
jgi:hypothetical protein